LGAEYPVFPPLWVFIVSAGLGEEEGWSPIMPNPLKTATVTVKPDTMRREQAQSRRHPRHPMRWGGRAAVAVAFVLMGVLGVGSGLGGSEGRRASVEEETVVVV